MKLKSKFNFVVGIAALMLGVRWSIVWRNDTDLLTLAMLGVFYIVGAVNLAFAFEEES